MNQTIVAVVITSIVAPILLFIIQQAFARRQHKLDYGDNLLDVTNKLAASLKQSRADISALELEMRNTDKEHTAEMSSLEKTWRERQDRMRQRVIELEAIIVKYDISFTLTTHPQVQVTDLKVVGKEDVSASQKMSAIRMEQDKK